MKLGQLVHKMGSDKTEVPMTVAIILPILDLHVLSYFFEQIDTNLVFEIRSSSKQMCQWFSPFKKVTHLFFDLDLNLRNVSICRRKGEK